MIFSIADLQSAEENFEAQEGEEGATADAEASYPLRCSLTITKVRKLILLPFLRLLTSSTQPSVSGALSVDAVCQEGVFVIENVSFYKDAKLATDLTAEADWKRRGLYIGPQVRFRVSFSITVEPAHSNCVHTSSRLSILTSRRSLRGSSKSVASMRASHCLFPSMHSTRSKRYALFALCGLMVTDRARVLGVCRLAKQSQELRRCLTDIILTYLTTSCKITSHLS